MYYIKYCSRNQGLLTIFFPATYSNMRLAGVRFLYKRRGGTGKRENAQPFLDCRYFPGVHPTADLKEEEKCWVFEYRRRDAISLMGITVTVYR